MRNEIDIELMYALRQFWGLGMATESSQDALDWLWSSTTFNRIYAQADTPNHRSFAVMCRLGMRLDSSSSALTRFVLERPVRNTRERI
jgi:RimJ/RimL family protein N-acetyltransferase